MRLFLPTETKKDADTDRVAFDCELKFAGGEDDTKSGTVEGYGSVFNVMDNGGDVILPGAFKRSLAEWKRRKSLPVMLWQHRSDQPIGMWTDISEDDNGLKCVGEIITDVPHGMTAHTLAKRGAVKGLSIGFRTVKADSDPKTCIRTIKEADLWEISLVTFPMNPRATMTAVKGCSPSERELERAYRDGGLSQREAAIAVAVTKKMVLRDGETTEQQHREGADLLLATRRAAALFS